MQASLAMAGFALGLTAWWWEGRDPRWLIGAFVLLAPWPYTLLVIKPVNDKLKAADPLGAGPATRALIEHWGRLHAGRTFLGVLAAATFLWAAMAR
jgi:Anthrone oxygenase